MEFAIPLGQPGVLPASASRKSSLFFIPSAFALSVFIGSDPWQKLNEPHRPKIRPPQVGQPQGPDPLPHLRRSLAPTLGTGYPSADHSRRRLASAMPAVLRHNAHPTGLSAQPPIHNRMRHGHLLRV